MIAKMAPLTLAQYVFRKTHPEELAQALPLAIWREYGLAKLNRRAGPIAARGSEPWYDYSQVGPRQTARAEEITRKAS